MYTLPSTHSLSTNPKAQHCVLKFWSLRTSTPRTPDKAHTKLFLWLQAPAVVQKKPAGSRVQSSDSSKWSASGWNGPDLPSAVCSTTVFGQQPPQRLRWLWAPYLEKSHLCHIRADFTPQNSPFRSTERLIHWIEISFVFMGWEVLIFSFVWCYCITDTDKGMLSDIITKISAPHWLKHLDCSAFPDPLCWKWNHWLRLTATLRNNILFTYVHSGGTNTITWRESPAERGQQF